MNCPPHCCAFTHYIADNFYLLLFNTKNGNKAGFVTEHDLYKTPLA